MWGWRDCFSVGGGPRGRKCFVSDLPIEEVLEPETRTSVRRRGFPYIQTEWRDLSSPPFSFFKVHSPSGGKV